MISEPPAISCQDLSGTREYGDIDQNVKCELDAKIRCQASPAVRPSKLRDGEWTKRLETGERGSAFRLPSRCSLQYDLPVIANSHVTTFHP